MKGIILAGGSGTRLYPLTLCVSKQLLPVYDKPVIHYPFSTMIQLGIKDILVISTPQDTPNIERLLGDGHRYGIRISYKVQDAPKGIAEAFVIGADFIGDEKVCLLLGDNLFFMTNDISALMKRVDLNNNDVFLFAHRVPDPERFGVVEVEKQGDGFRVLSIEEKPKVPKSNYVATGLYIYPADVAQKAAMLKPSVRGELEITDLNNLYLKEGRVQCEVLKAGSVWVDVGTPQSLLKAAYYVEMVEEMQSIKLSCLEEVAYRAGFITRAQFERNIETYARGSDYRAYLSKVLDG